MRRVAALIALATALAGCRFGRGTEVATAEVREDRVVESVSAPARVEAKNFWQVRSPANGTVVQVFVADGKTVRKDAAIMLIDSPQVSAAVAQAQAAHDAAWQQYRALSGVRLDASGATAALQGVLSAFQSVTGAASDLLPLLPPAIGDSLRDTISDTESQLTAASSQVSRSVSSATASTNQSIAALRSAALASHNAAEKQLAIARAQQARLRVKAPGPGVLVIGAAGGGLPGGLTIPGLPTSGAPSASQPPIRAGNDVAAGQLLFTIHDTAGWRVVADFEEEDVPRLRAGMRAEATVDALQRTLPAALAAIATSASESEGVASFRVEFAVDDAADGTGLRVGMTAQVEVILAESETLPIVPESAIVRDGDARVVYVVVDERARARTVTVRASDGTRAAVEGVGAGDLVIVSPADVSDGDRVRLKRS